MNGFRRSADGEHVVIEVQGLCKQYDRLAAVSDLSFAVRPGEIMGLVGPNGAGKTTTLRCVTGIIPATSGTVRVLGEQLDATGWLAVALVSSASIGATLARRKPLEDFVDSPT